ncbi:MAG TPA: histidine kinase [Thermoanaerobaculia bacterium]|nr:histidine kinase [Thermoanaerobaculia bacterium]
MAAGRGLPGRSRATLVVAVLAAAFGALQAATISIGLKQEANLSFQPSFARMLAYQIVAWLVWGAIAPLIFELGERFRPERPVRFVAVHVPAALAASMLNAAVGVAAIAVFRPFGASPQGRVLPRLVGRFTNSLPLEFLIYGVILGAGYAVEYYRGFRDRELRAAQLERRLAEARLEALALQLQPHFLFNALHTVAGLVRQGENTAAVEVLARLSDLLRATLQGSGRPLVPLSEELALADLYLAIQQVRFADRLRVERAIDPELAKAAVPPFVLQPLLENAVRHGLGARSDAGSLRIVAERAGEGERFRLEVHDDGRGIEGPPSERAGGVGLSNTRARLAEIYGEAAKLELLSRAEGGVVARLTLPVIPAPEPERQAPA